MVASILAESVKQIAALIEGQFLDSFEIAFSVDGDNYLLALSKFKT